LHQEGGGVFVTTPTALRRRVRRALVSAAVIAAGVALTPALGTAPHLPAATAAGVGDCNPGATWPANRQDYADRVVVLVNQHRAAMGLVQLKVSSTMTGAAVWKARHMAYYGYMQHDDPAPPIVRTWFQRVQACGYPGSGAGENIAYGYTTPEAVMAGWLNSPGHKANIENPSYRVIGVGSAGATRVYWSQDFGTTDDAGATPPPPPPPPGDTTSPTAPSLTGSAPSSTQASLTWGASTDNVGVTGYRVYRNGAQIATTASTTRSFTDSGLTGGTTYSYTVKAYDAAGNLSASSNTATVTTPGSPPPPPPPPPPPAGTTVYASLLYMQSGSAAGGGISSLRAEDGVSFDVAATSTAAWYAKFNTPRALTALSLTYAGSSTQPCTQTISVYDWSVHMWKTVDTRTAGSTTTKVIIPLSGTLTRFVEGTASTGDIRVRAACSRSDAVGFTNRSDVLTIAYSA
jgi:uncharacterized protein YkwD/chitodextrinase